MLVSLTKRGSSATYRAWQQQMRGNRLVASVTAFSDNGILVNLIIIVIMFFISTSLWN
jgi:hypothetical protein